MDPYIHIQDIGSKAIQAIFGLQLVSIPAFSSDPGRASHTGLQKYSDLINQLYLPDLSVSFSLRTVYCPHQENGQHSAVEIALFGILNGTSKRELNKRVEQVQHQMRAILVSSFPYHDFQWISNNQDFIRLYSPPFLEGAHFCEIRKRESAIHLNSNHPEKAIGFLRNEEPGFKPNQEDMVYFSHPFSPREADFEQLYRLLISNGHPFILNICLTPTVLDSEEEKALISEIAKGEGFQPKAEIPLRQIYLDRARLIRQGLIDQLLRLQDAPFYCQIFLASSEPIGRGIAEAVGSVLSQSVGSGSALDHIDLRLQMGGYDVLFPEDEEDQSNFAKDFFQPGKSSWGKTIAGQKLERFRFLVDGYQGTCGFRFPDAENLSMVDFKTHQTKLTTPPREINALAHQDGIEKKMIGTNAAFGVERPIYLAEKDLRQHVYIVGQSGTGKTTLLKSMILGDIANHKGVAVIDPHGDLYDELLGLIPQDRVDDVVLLDPLDMTFPVGFNLLACDDLSKRIFIAREIKAIMHRLLHDTFGQVSNNYIGPIFYKHVQMNLLLAMSDPENPGTLLEFYQIFQNDDYWKKWLPLKWDEPLLANWVEEVLPRINYTYRNRADNVSMGEYVGSKFDDFILDPRLQLIFGQKESTIDLGEIMDNGKILLINLAKGLLGEATAQFLGLIIMAKFQSEILARGNQKIEERRPFTLYVDEFQSLATENFGLLLSEARKFGVSLVLANQFISQIKDTKIMDAVFGNVGTMLSFRVGKDDAVRLEPQFSPQFTRHELANFPNWTACIKTTLNGQNVPPFNLQTIPSAGLPDPEVKELVMAESRRKYSRPAAEVREIIKESLKQPEVENEDNELRLAL
ncbi:type IV secretory system conjugative DNA transfer family protein [Chloroflexota bacterium]|nr:type IV secretory system conjugative DNA transfer family protein [Chloroflexota bacterium]